MELATKYKVQILALMLWTLPDWLGQLTHPAAGYSARSVWGTA